VPLETSPGCVNTLVGGAGEGDANGNGLASEPEKQAFLSRRMLFSSRISWRRRGNYFHSILIIIHVLSFLHLLFFCSNHLRARSLLNQNQQSS